MSRCTWIQRTTYETWFSHFIMWVLEIEVRLSCFMATDLTSEPPAVYNSKARLIYIELSKM